MISEGSGMQAEFDGHQQDDPGIAARGDDGDDGRGQDADDAVEHEGSLLVRPSRRPAL